MIEYGLLSVGDQPEGVAAVRAMLAPDHFREAAFEVAGSELPVLRRALRVWSDSQGLALILTVGGIGLGPRERAADATLELIERQAPGLAELLRLAGVQRARSAALSRGVAGVRGRTLIVNLPAADTATALEALLPLLAPALTAVRPGA